MDFGQGWRQIADPITVTLRRASDGGEQEVKYVLKREATLEDVQQEPAIIEEETAAFHVWQDWLAGTVPAKGDKLILADGGVWHVVRRQTQNHGRKFRLTCFLERS